MGDIPEASILRGEHPAAAAEEKQRLIFDMGDAVGLPLLFLACDEGYLRDIPC
jgi:hypothetical protein